MSLLNKTKGNAIFLYTFICLKNYVWTFHFFLKIIILKAQAKSENWWKKKKKGRERERKESDKTKERKRLNKKRDNKKIKKIKTTYLLVTEKERKKK